MQRWWGWQAESEGAPSCGLGKHQFPAWLENVETSEPASNVAEVGLARGLGSLGLCPHRGDGLSPEICVGVSKDLGDTFATGFFPRTWLQDAHPPRHQLWEAAGGVPFPNAN